MTEPDNPDYVTVSHVPGTRSYTVRVMGWDKQADGYIVKQETGRMSQQAATHYARCRAAIERLEYRP